MWPVAQDSSRKFGHRYRVSDAGSVQCLHGTSPPLRSSYFQPFDTKLLQHLYFCNPSFPLLRVVKYTYHFPVRMAAEADTSEECENWKYKCALITGT